MVGGLFLLVLFVAITAAIFAMEQEAMTGASVIAVRVAAGGTDDTGVSGLGTNRHSLVAAEQRAIRIAGPALAGARLVGNGGRDCSAYQPAHNGDIVVCAYNEPNSLVTVRFKGRLGVLVAQEFGFGQGVLVNVHASVHSLTFSR